MANSSSPSGERIAVVEEWIRSANRKLDDILAQTTRTNGRVDALESFRDKVEGGWTGGWKVALFLGGLIGFAIAHVVPIVIALFLHK